MSVSQQQLDKSNSQNAFVTAFATNAGQLAVAIVARVPESLGTTR